jgi:anaerobic C4-dicarboxylate transporter
MDGEVAEVAVVGLGEVPAVVLEEEERVVVVVVVVVAVAAVAAAVAAAVVAAPAAGVPSNSNRLRRLKMLIPATFPATLFPTTAHHCSKGKVRSIGYGRSSGFYLRLD